MKNIFKSMMLLAATAMTFAACQPNEIETTETTGTHTVKFTVSSDFTKTTMTEGETAATFAWEEYDMDHFHLFENGVEANECIGVLNGDGKVDITAEFSNSTATEFEYTGFMAAYTVTVDSKVYPAIKDEQTYEEVYDHDFDILIAKPVAVSAAQTDFAGETALQFKRVIAINKATIKGLKAGEHLESAAFTAAEGGLTGYYDFVADKWVADDNKILTVVCNQDVAADGTAPIYFLSTPVADANLSIYVCTSGTDEDGIWSAAYNKTFAKPITLLENKLNRFSVNLEGFIKPLFYESFDQTEGTGANDEYGWDGSIKTNNASGEMKYDNNDESNPWVVEKAGGAYHCAKFGTAKVAGSATTPNFKCEGVATLTFKAGAWTGDATTLNLSVEHGNIYPTSVTLADAAWTEYTAVIYGVEDDDVDCLTKITFAAVQNSKNRFFLDEVKVVPGGEAPASVAVTGVTVAPATANIEVGQTVALEATVAPEDATNKTVTWSSSNTDVATVADGVVTAVSAGNATITVTTADGGFTADCVVNVTILSDYSTIAEIMSAGEGTYSVQNAVVMAKAGSNVIISDGTANIMLYHSGNELEVGDVITISNQAVTERNSLYQFATDTYEVAEDKVTPDYGTPVEIMTDEDVANWGGVPQYQYIHFKGLMGTDNRNIKCGEKGIYIYNTAGYAGKNVEVYGYANGKMSTYGTITTTLVSIAEYVSTTPVSGVTLNNSSLSLTVGGTSTLVANVSPVTASNKEVTWSSSNSSVATVSTTGVVTAVAAGEATITVTTVDGNFTDSCTVTVAEAPVGSDTKTLTFTLNSNPGGWPTVNPGSLTNYTYTLNNVDYTFALKNVKCNSGYLMLTQPAVLGLPAISGYKLTKVVAKNSSGCSTSVKVGISSSDSSPSYITGGAIQTWATTGSTYTYTLSDTSVNTMYYLYVTNKNCQIISLELTYEN